MPYLIDGYNLLWEVNKINSEYNESISDVSLCLSVDRFMELIGDKGEIVFDGIGPPDKAGFDGLRNVEICFSGTNTDADSVIESKIELNSAPKRLFVVSTDRRLRDSARSRKAVSVRSDEFWYMMDSQLSKKRKVNPEHKGKRAGLSDIETNQWMDFFGID